MADRTPAPTSQPVVSPTSEPKKILKNSSNLQKVSGVTATSGTATEKVCYGSQENKIFGPIESGDHGRV